MQISGLLGWHLFSSSRYCVVVSTFKTDDSWLFSKTWLFRHCKGWYTCDVQGQVGGNILDVDGHGGWGVLKIRQFSWTSYVYRTQQIISKSQTF